MSWEEIFRILRKHNYNIDVIRQEKPELVTMEKLQPFWLTEDPERLKLVAIDAEELIAKHSWIKDEIDNITKSYMQYLHLRLNHYNEQNILVYNRQSSDVKFFFTRSEAIAYIRSVTKHEYLSIVPDDYLPEVSMIVANKSFADYHQYPFMVTDEHECYYFNDGILVTDNVGAFRQSLKDFLDGSMPRLEKSKFGEYTTRRSNEWGDYAKQITIYRFSDETNTDRYFYAL